jgi:hypothetical protein
MSCLPAIALLLVYLHVTSISDGVPWEWVVTQHARHMPWFRAGVRDWHVARHMQPRQTHSHEHVLQTQAWFNNPIILNVHDMSRRIYRRAAVWFNHDLQETGSICCAHRRWARKQVSRRGGCRRVLNAIAKSKFYHAFYSRMSEPAEIISAKELVVRITQGIYLG